jgi:hypothetical protein
MAQKEPSKDGVKILKRKKDLDGCSRTEKINVNDVEKFFSFVLTVMASLASFRDLFTRSIFDFRSWCRGHARTTS